MGRLLKLFSLSLIAYLGLGGIIFKPNPNIKTWDFYGVGYVEGPTTCGSCVAIGDGSWIITAAHVLPDYKTAHYVASFIYKDPHEYVIDKVIVHPVYDIALCHLNRRSPQPYEISSKRMPLGTVFYSGGYGRSSRETDIDTIKYEIGPGDLVVFKNIIEESTFDPVSLAELDTYDLSCPEESRTLPGEGIIGPGDSGGGNFVYQGTRPILIGISVSMGFTSHWEGHTTRYGGFIPLSEVKDWIDDNLPREVERDTY